MNTEIIPLRPVLPAWPGVTVSVDPLAVLARQRPDETTSILRRQMAGIERAARLGALRGVAHDHADVACTWLARRSPSEQNMQVETCGASLENGFFCSNGERFWLRTRVSIW